MPFVIVRTSTPINASQEAELESRLGAAIAVIPGKDERGLLLDFEDNCRLWLAGDHDEPIAYVEASVFANEGHAGYEAFSHELARCPVRRAWHCAASHLCALHGHPRVERGRHGRRPTRVGLATMAVVTITHFTDPMMGLSWELEPALRRLEVRFGEHVAFRTVISLLVRDVSDFMTPDERSLPDDEGLARYNTRLAQIYLQEEPLAGMPINMEGFALFAPDRRSSLPLCLAFEAVSATWPDLAQRFLYLLRFATVVECRPITKVEELTRIARRCGIDEDAFLASYHGARAQDLLYRDLALKTQLGIYGLPALLVQSDEHAVLLEGVPRYPQIEQAILQVGGGLSLKQPPQGPQALAALLAEHPLISDVEIAFALGLKDPYEVLALADQLEPHTAQWLSTPKGRFLTTARSLFQQ